MVSHHASKRIMSVIALMAMLLPSNSSTQVITDSSVTTAWEDFVNADGVVSNVDTESRKLLLKKCVNRSSQ